MKKPLFAANWKMNKTPQETQIFFEKFLEAIKLEFQSSFLFFVPTINLVTTASCLSNTKVKWGAQNCYFENKGAFTGELSPEVLKQVGASVCLVGHSERRTLFQETNSDVSLKVKALWENSITSLICVGESLKEREQGRTLEIIEEQLAQALETKPSSFILAYEPVWAIGTGKVAEKSQIQEVHDFIKTKVSSQIPVLYGGSVKADVAQDIFSIDSVDGFLVGGASLEVESFIAIQKSLEKNFS